MLSGMDMREENSAFSRAGEDRQKIIDFVLDNKDVLGRLLATFTKASAEIEDDLHILSEPVFVTVGATSFSICSKSPRRKRRSGAGYRVTLELQARQQGEAGTISLGISLAVAFCRMQQAIIIADVLRALGDEASKELNCAIETYAAQINATSYWIDH